MQRKSYSEFANLIYQREGWFQRLLRADTARDESIADEQIEHIDSLLIEYRN